MYSRTEYAACPLCDAPRSNRTIANVASCTGHALWRDGLPAQINWFSCGGCGHVHTDGYFDGPSLEFLFAKTQDSQTPGYNVEAQRYVAADMVERVISERGSSRGRWLDVGFGSGSLLTTADEYGFDVTGIDLRETSCAPLRKLGYNVSSAELMALDEPAFGVFDIISLCDVLEHMPFPRPALTRCADLLRPGGTLFLSMPNADCFAWRALDKVNQNPYWQELEHYHNFGRKRLERLLRLHGFEPVSYSVSKRYRLGMELIAKLRPSSRYS
jgi:protein O-GlcNAc transferase